DSSHPATVRRGALWPAAPPAPSPPAPRGCTPAPPRGVTSGRHSPPTPVRDGPVPVPAPGLTDRHGANRPEQSHPGDGQIDPPASPEIAHRRPPAPPARGLPATSR